MRGRSEQSHFDDDTKAADPLRYGALTRMELSKPRKGSRPMNPTLLVAALVPLFLAPLCPSPEARPTPPSTSRIPEVVLPLERANYLVGETVLLAIANHAKPYQMRWRDAGDHVAVSYQGSESILEIRTGQLAPGRYQVWIDNQPSPTTIGLTSPLRVSPAAFTDAAPSLALTPEDRANLQAALRKNGVNAIMAETYDETGSGRYSAHDELATTGTVVFFHPYTRMMRFHPARVYEPELSSFRQRLALCAQANGRYPTFGGFLYDQDSMGFGDRRSLLTAGTWGKEEPALRNYLRRSFHAVLDDFATRTKLKPVTDADYWRYCQSINRPELAPVSDPLAKRWAAVLGQTLKPLTDAEQAQLEMRLDAWSSYLMGLYAQSYEGHNAILREILPSLRNTSSVNAEQESVRKGPYTPSAYAPLDFRYVSSENNSSLGPADPYQWLVRGALMDAGRKSNQPVWLAPEPFPLPGAAAYPGLSMRMAAQSLAYGGLGLGARHSDSRKEEPPSEAREEDRASAREFLRRFADLGGACGRVRHIGLLYSRTQLGRQHFVPSSGSPQVAAFITLARLGYTPRWITEEDIVDGGLVGMKALVVANQCFPLPAHVTKRIEAFVAAGGRIVADRQTTVALPQAERVDVKMPYEVLERLPTSAIQERRHQELAPAMLAALGNDGRTGLRSRRGAASRISTFQLQGGPDATYVVAVNDAILDTPASWVRHSEELVPNRNVSWVLYDLTKEQALGRLAPVTCAFEDLTARVYGILRQPVDTIDVQAVQRLTGGEELQVRVRFTGANGKVLRAAIPFHLAWQRPDGTTAHEFYRSTDQSGDFVAAWTVPVNEPTGSWTLEVRSQLDGMTASLPVKFEAGDKLEAEPVTERVIVRGTGVIQSLLAKKPKFVLPVFTNEHHTRLLSAAQKVQRVLAKKDVPVEICPNPTLSIYVMGYDPSRVELLQNMLAEKGETIGKIKMRTPPHQDYSAALSGYVFGKPIILLDLAGSGANEIAARLEKEGLLWPRAGAVFPGPGRAVIQLVKSAFWLGQDALVIQAGDMEGMQAAAAALADLPADRITATVDGARQQLLTELGIGVTTPPVPDEDELTSEELATRWAPQPLAIRFGRTQPPPAPVSGKR
jgi:hypothetical protein